MCTLSWWISEDSRGILFNRDEKRTRSSGQPPEILHSGGRQILAPRDPDAGGTWAGVNAYGCIIAILNNYPHHQHPIQGQRSRGQLVLGLLSKCKDTESFTRNITNISLQEYRGFILFAMDTQSPPLALSWDGSELKPLTLPANAQAQMLTTSSVRQAECIKHRENLFSGIPPQQENLRANHINYNDKDPALGPLMARDDAATDSITQISVGSGHARVRFESVQGFPPRLLNPAQVDLELTD